MAHQDKGRAALSLIEHEGFSGKAGAIYGCDHSGRSAADDYAVESVGHRPETDGACFSVCTIDFQSFVGTGQCRPARCLLHPANSGQMEKAIVALR